MKLIIAFASLNEVLINSVLGIVIVFTALTILALAFALSAKIIKFTSKKRTVKAGKSLDNHPDELLDSYTAAAISTAIHMYITGKEKHIEESNIITIKRIQKRYSPWSSKIYSMNNVHQVKK